MSVVTATTDQALWVSEGLWKGRYLWVTSDRSCPGHDLSVMHHLDDAGRHYCPTGFLLCSRCGGTADEPEPYQCERWAGRDPLT